VLTAAAATAVALSAQVSAHAAPSKPSVDEVKAQVDKLTQDQEQASEVYNGANERANQLRTQAAQLQDQVARGQEQMQELATGLSAVAAEQYRNGGIDPSVALMLSSNPQGYLEQASSAAEVTATQAETLKSLKDEQRRLDQQKQEAADVLAELDRSTKVLNDAKAQVQQKLQETKQLLSQLSYADRQAVMGDRASRSDNRAALQGLPQGSGYAAAAVSFAESKLGHDYVWGAEGPNVFDCSGLMEWAYGQAGVSLPRTSQEQATVGTRVDSIADAQPGDLLIFFNDRHHVGMYIGGGKFIHAPKTGDVVKIADVSVMQINTIRRV
jgi:cell wall-associated NlpC family hydrolase